MPLLHVEIPKVVLTTITNGSNCYIYDDEKIGSKASDIKVHSLSDRKAAGEGSTMDCLCDSFFHIVLGMQIQTVMMMDRSSNKLDHISLLL